MRIAVIGTREPNQFQIDLCRSVVEIEAHIHTIVSGGANGIDNLALTTAESVRPGSTLIFLPWSGYNTAELSHLTGQKTVYTPGVHKAWADSVNKYHPAAKRLSQGAFKLHARNYGIIDVADVVLAFPSFGGGGTAQGMRIAQDLKKPLYVFYPNDIDKYIPVISNFFALITPKKGGE